MFDYKTDHVRTDREISTLRQSVLGIRRILASTANVVIKTCNRIACRREHKTAPYSDRYYEIYELVDRLSEILGSVACEQHTFGTLLHHQIGNLSAQKGVRESQSGLRIGL